MSGPKGGSYVVETPAQREARMLRDAQADYSRAECEWTLASAKLEAAAHVSGRVLDYTRPAPVRRRADSAEYTRAAADLMAAATAAVTASDAACHRVATEQHAEQIARMIAHVDSREVDHAPARPSRWSAGQPTDVPLAAGEVDHVRAARRVEGRLAAFAALDHDAARVHALVADITAAGTEARVDLLIGELDFLLGAARVADDRATRRQQTLAELSAMQARMETVESDPNHPLRKRLASLISGGATEVPDEIATAVTASIAEADAEADRQHVVRVMHAALHELGYSTGPEFSTALSGALGTAYARSGSGHYGLKVRIEPEAKRFTAQAVKSDARLTSTDEDVAAEQEFCSTLERIVDIARREGVSFDVDIRTQAGTCAVQEVPAHTLAVAAAQNAARAAGGHTREQHAR